jgi:hypothetical protein
MTVSQPFEYATRFRTHNSVPSLIYEVRRVRERGSVAIKALCYKPEGRGFDTRRREFLNLPNPSGRTRPWGLLSL